MPNGARARPSKANLRPDHNGPQRAQFEFKTGVLVRFAMVCKQTSPVINASQISYKSKYCCTQKTDEPVSGFIRVTISLRLAVA